MKKLFLSAAIAVIVNFGLNAQETQFGVTAGFASANGTVKFEGASISASDSGFYIGGVADIGISDELHIQPELLYVNINDGSSLFIPVMVKYYVAESFNIQAGPQIGISLEETSDDYSSLSIGLGAGVGYDITEDFFVEGRYGIQLNNSYTGDADFSSKANLLTIGVGYKFN